MRKSYIEKMPEKKLHEFLRALFSAAWDALGWAGGDGKGSTLYTYTIQKYQSDQVILVVAS